MKKIALPDKVFKEIIDGCRLNMNPAEAACDDEIIAFLKEKGYDMSIEEFEKLLKENAVGGGNINEETLKMMHEDTELHEWFWYRPGKEDGKQSN